LGLVWPVADRPVVGRFLSPLGYDWGAGCGGLPARGRASRSAPGGASASSATQGDPDRSTAPEGRSRLAPQWCPPSRPPGGTPASSATHRDPYLCLDHPPWGEQEWEGTPRWFHQRASSCLAPLLLRAPPLRFFFLPAAACCPSSAASIKPSSMASRPVARCLLRAICTCAHTHAEGEHRGENAACRLRFLSRRLLLFLGMSSSVCAESLVSRSPRMKGIVRGLSRAPLVARWPAEYSSLMSVARLELHCMWGSVGRKDAAAQGGMAGGAQARALACGAAGMPDGGRAPVAGRIDAQRRPEEASAGVSCLPRPSDIFETRAGFC
jgi:hypothetical protein